MRKMSLTKQVYTYVNANPYATVKQIATATQIPSETVSKLLWQLAKRNVVTQIKMPKRRANYIATPGATFRKARKAKATATAKRTYTKRTNTVTVTTDVVQGLALLQQALKKLQLI